MNYKAFSKTLLEVYNSLEIVCERIDKMVDNKASEGSTYGRTGNSLELFNSIINLTERKVNLINLKLRIEQSLIKLSPIEAKVLILKYVDRLTYKQISTLTNQNIRTTFRYVEKGIENFTKNIKLNGLTEEFIRNKYSEEKWLFQICEMNETSKSLDKENLCTIINKKDIVNIATKRALAL